MDLLTQAFVFLAAGVIAVPIASRLGLGSVLGYLIAGALIGPSALKLINETEHVMHFAEFGVVMMLFLVGLELQPQVLWRMRKPILGLGGLQVIITTLAITGCAVALGLAWQTSMAIGLILALSSTAIALQILEEKRLMKSEAGKSSFAVLLFQDIAVIPIIALLPLLALSDITSTKVDDHASSSIISHLVAWQQALIVLAVIASIIFIGRYLIRHLFRFIAESGLREIFTAAALLLVIGIALLMNLVGLSPALGAFIAGVVLANNEYRHELEANIDPFKALLLGLFFISVGAGIDFSLIAEKPLIIMGLVLALILVKFVILWVLARVFGLLRGDKFWFIFALAQGGEFGFVLLSLSSASNVIPKDIVGILTAVIALSMVLTPILILLNEKYIQPLYDKDNNDSMEETMEHQHNPVIIAGFGRFGQIVGRLLIANQCSVTVLDHSASNIARVREYGFMLYYGDASRLDLLETAGAKEAKLLIIAIDSRKKTNAAVAMAKKHFPHLKVLARAYDVIHYHELRELGADHIEREVFQGSLSLGKKALQELGVPAYSAERKAALFAKHDEDTIHRLHEHRDDRKRFISESRIAQNEMMEIFKAENPEVETDSAEKSEKQTS
ncbi:monovalent cation:proton antiporter-2 (CPA2) family protein [Cocleimonas sp. KMM 6892]|uniref:monovalent cation:proton antiporter-2 (CPA2) family protein n=1 Tax=unclassified Cocleimonas TaxID=2639732 RepID=UPI002DBD786E|nr:MULTISPECIES: monovalent cation:proton antiporter-2 (CPA2) family protein [unclassified Cocleimonas]MEB8432797.1 monovalent cation:proton antiporter-2 (CPA2) family protein [Cocleimonas sp. KMM 6892]MEC4715656.1 monovalent cation:proton antiporter-2 (CPA2) family protein [Cocleimonas sp. KMM 6895]MEC4744726.1 monovalent cation:proton antiporter-2 (CPA2) family protein [Cocleimonas sp. KMM 6896]